MEPLYTIAECVSWCIGYQILHEMPQILNELLFLRTLKIILHSILHCAQETMNFKMNYTREACTIFLLLVHDAQHMRTTRSNRVLVLCFLASNHGSTNSQSFDIAINLDIIASSKLTPMTIFQNDQELRPIIETIGMSLGVLQLDKDSTMSR